MLNEKRKTPVFLRITYVHTEYTRQTATFLVCQLLLQSDNFEIMSFLLVVLSRIYSHLFCYFFEARHPSRPTAYPIWAYVYIYIYIFPINVTASQVLPPNIHYFFYSLGAPKVGKEMCSVSRNIPTGYDISISVPKIRDMDTVCRYIVL